MEYLAYRGEFADIPIDAMRATFEEHYAHMIAGDEDEGADFDRDVEAETERRG